MTESQIIKGTGQKHGTDNYSALRKALDILSKAVEYFGIFMIFVMTSITIYQVIVRFVFHNPSSWSEELSIFLMMWIGYLGISVGIKERKHTSIEFFVDLLPGPAKKIVIKIGDILVLGFNILMAYYGLILLGNAGESVLPATSIPVSMVYAPLVVGGILNSIYGFIQVIGLEHKLLD